MLKNNYGKYNVDVDIETYVDEDVVIELNKKHTINETMTSAISSNTINYDSSNLSEMPTTTNTTSTNTIENSVINMMNSNSSAVTYQSSSPSQSTKINPVYLFYMPHCPYRLYCNLLWANWHSLHKIFILGNR